MIDHAGKPITPSFRNHANAARHFLGWNALNLPLNEIRVLSAIRANKPGGSTMNRTCPANRAARYAMRQDGEFYARP
jgi:hypothetical protein